MIGGGRGDEEEEEEEQRRSAEKFHRTHQLMMNEQREEYSRLFSCI